MNEPMFWLLLGGGTPSWELEGCAASCIHTAIRIGTSGLASGASLRGVPLWARRSNPGCFMKYKDCFVAEPLPRQARDLRLAMTNKCTGCYCVAVLPLGSLPAGRQVRGLRSTIYSSCQSSNPANPDSDNHPYPLRFPCICHVDLSRLQAGARLCEPVPIFNRERNILYCQNQDLPDAMINTATKSETSFY